MGEHTLQIVTDAGRVAVTVTSIDDDVTADDVVELLADEFDADVV